MGTKRKKRPPNAGNAYGKDRVYQVLCRNIIQQIQQQEGLLPYAGDGIDVPIMIAGREWKIDVALKDMKNKVVFAECKRWKDTIQQGEIAKFAYLVEMFRKESGLQVEGIYFTKTGYQQGAVEAARVPGIQIAVVAENQSLNPLIVHYRQYDVEREEVIKQMLLVNTDQLEARSELTVQLQMVLEARSELTVQLQMVSAGQPDRGEVVVDQQVLDEERNQES